MTGSINETNTTVHVTTQDIVFATLYAFIVLPGVVGNLIVITIVRKTPSMHTTTNYLLMNLAVADLLTLLFCPGLYDFALCSVKLPQTAGDFICKIFAGNAVISVTAFESILTLTVIAIERYFSLVKPFQTNLRLRKENVGFAIAATWIVAALSCLPGILANTYDSRAAAYPCTRPWTLDNLAPKKGYIVFQSVSLIITPTIIVTFSYLSVFRGIYFTRTIFGETQGNLAEEQSKTRLVKLVVSLTVAFVLCCLPFAVFFLYLCSISQSSINRDYQTLFLIHRSVRFLLIFNSFINLLLYALQSSNYREGLGRIFQCSKRRAVVSDIELQNRQPIEDCKQ